MRSHEWTINDIWNIATAVAAELTPADPALAGPIFWVAVKAGLWTLDWTMDWTVDWTVDWILDRNLDRALD